MTTRSNIWSRYTIRWLIGQQHVTASDAHILGTVARVMSDTNYVPSAIKAAQKFALKVHWDNQKIAKNFGGM